MLTPIVARVGGSWEEGYAHIMHGRRPNIIDLRSRGGGGGKGGQKGGGVRN